MEVLRMTSGCRFRLDVSAGARRIDTAPKCTNINSCMVGYPRTVPRCAPLNTWGIWALLFFIRLLHCAGSLQVLKVAACSQMKTASSD